ncbi:CB1 cannabinoid receptor-interacting protein 1 [Aphelenchoides besseyi]|nr:CB1 cannabinoid receptor-interacting protein 1 [Aphelenchoides besseyi]KAI6236635.1 CB1 cannabinoid receptor-interacting protein 1 [Aphelenchoides besseyi]
MPLNSGLQINIRITNAETNEKIAFKQDGKRFETSERTLKLCSNAKYKIQLTCQPHADFYNLHFGGSDLELASSSATNSGDYTSFWNTTGIDPTRRGAREDLLFVLTGPSGTLRQNVQTKFYNKEDKNATNGHRLESLIWKCKLDQTTGTISVVEEETK